MAESILNIAEKIFNIAEKLVNMACIEAQALQQVNRDVKSITDTLQNIASDLEKSNVMTDRENEFDIWVRELRQLAFQAEDVIEVFLNNETPYQGCNIFPLIWGCCCQFIALKKLENEIVDFNNRLNTLKEQKDKGNLINVRSDSEDPDETSFIRHRVAENQPARNTSVEDDDVDDIVGFKDVAAKLLSSLNEKEQLGKLHVISIWAQAGAGKTALASHIQKKCYVGGYFDCVACVSISPNYNVEDVSQSILKQVKKHTVGENNEHGTPTADAATAALQGKDYLIILDDLWRKEDWENIKKIFPASSGKKCRVLITTRNDEVARHANRLIEPFELRLLDEKESLELFFVKVFGCSSKNVPNATLSEDMKNLAWQLALKCERLPIAIVILGGLLSGKIKNEHVWSRMLEKVRSNLRESRAFQKVFALSYNELSYIFKSCFLYLGLFPEDSLIDCDRLVRLWVAEGFFEQKKHEDKEDYGIECLEDLIQRSMIQVVERKSNGTPLTCHFHDLVRFTVEDKAKSAKFSSICKNNRVKSVEAGIRRIAVPPDVAMPSSAPLPPSLTSSSAPLPSSLMSSSAPLQPSLASSSAPLQSSLNSSPATDILGFEEEANKVASLLMEEEPLGQLNVVSITAMEGAGKTTLATKVYRRVDVESHFACRAWVPVSQYFTMIDILKTILQQVTTLTNAESKVGDPYELQSMLHHHLKEKSRYLIVFDDVWRQENWDIFEKILPIQREQKCRVLLTTRSDSIATYASRSTDLVLRLRSLNRDESFQILSQMLEDEIPSEDATSLAQTWVKTASYGHPGSLKAVAGFLIANDASKWNSVMAYLRESSGESLIISAKDLPDYLRYCLGCCSVFPEDTEIDCDKLTRLWVAKGFLNRMYSSGPIEHFAVQCLEELVQRTLIQVTKRRQTGAPETCRIRGFSMRCARHVQLPFRLENADLDLVEGINRPEKDTQAPSPPHFQPPKTFNLVKALLPVLDLFNFPNHLHSLLCFSKTPQVHFKAFPLLRVLDLEGAENIDQLPKEIGNLTLLRYLGLRGTPVSNIPPWITKLLNLQTLDAPGAQVPLDILKLSQLRHLFAHSFYAPQTKCFPNSSRSLHFNFVKQLQTLEVDVDDWEIYDLRECTNLRVLKLRFRRTADTLLDAIKGLTRLMFLSLTRVEESSSSRPLMQLPSLLEHNQLVDIVVVGTVTEAKEFPRLVTYLWLEVSIKRQVDPFYPFQGLSHLKKLCLRLSKCELSSSDAVRMTCSKGGFPKLEYLYIKFDVKLEDWIVEEGAFPILKVLHIEGEGRFGKLPDGLKHVKTLKELVVPRGCDVPESLNDGREVKNKVTIKYLNQSYMRP